MDENNTRRKIAIACQGGGAHAAFAAGVLTKILERKGEYEIVALSGTSGGAICAYLAWYELLNDDESQAIKKLNTFWTEDNVASYPTKLEDLRKATDKPEANAPWPGEAWLANDVLKSMYQLWDSAGFTTPLPSPYNLLLFPHFRRFWPYGRTPDYWQDQLKRMIEEQVSDEQIKKRMTEVEQQGQPPGLSPRLYISAVNPITGEFKVFRSHKRSDENQSEYHFNRSASDRISVEAVLASAAIPPLFKAVYTAKDTYWDSSNQRDLHTKSKEGVYWDGLYSSNPPIWELVESNPDEIWVIQINPEEIQINPEETDDLPRDTADIEDRRNELAGNLSLNQELAFVRRTNEMVRRFGEYKDGKLKLVDGSRADEKEYRIIKVRRIELTEPLDYASKLDRSSGHVNKLMGEYTEKEAEPFLEALATLSPFEKAWDEALSAWKGAQQGEGQDGEKDTEDQAKVLDAVVNLFADEATIRLVPPDEGSSASEQPPYESKEAIRRCVRRCVRWCLEGNFNLEQARYYRVPEKSNRVAEKEVRWWMLVTTDRFGFPVKGLAKMIIEKGKIKYFAFYPVDMNTVEELEERSREEDRERRRVK